MHTIHPPSGEETRIRAGHGLSAAKHPAPSRGRSPERTPSIDRYDTEPTPSFTSTTPSKALCSPRPPHVHFGGEESALPHRVASYRRLPNPVSADFLRDTWAALRARLQLGIGAADKTVHTPEAAAPQKLNADDVTPQEAVDLVDVYVEQCARQIAAARVRERSHRKALRGLLEYASYLHANANLSEDERQYDDQDPHSMTAALRQLLASLDVELNIQRGDTHSENGRATPLPELVFDSESDPEDAWVVDMSLDTPPPQTHPLPSV